MVRLLICLSMPLAIAAGVCAADAPIDGNWRVSYFSSPSAEVTTGIVKFETKDGKTVGTLLTGNARQTEVTLAKAEVSGQRVHLVFKVGTAEQIFEGWINDKEKDKVSGTYDDDRRVYIAQMTRTDKTSLDPSEALTRRELPEPMQKAVELSGKLNQILVQVQQVREPEDKIRLLNQAIEAVKETQSELPKLYAAVIDKHADDVAVFDAALQLVRGAAKAKANDDEVRKWANAAAKAAERYGPGWQKEIGVQIAQTLLPQKAYTDVALEHAQQAADQLKDTDAANRQRRVLKILANLQQQGGKTDGLKQTDARLEKIEQILDKEYVTKVPPLQAEAFAGRKKDSDRAVLMELFTGAECGPCVAADVAFDALAKTYKPSELILLQYHLHIPNSDPLTNPDSEARMSYYRKKFPTDMRGTPSTVFNGKPQAGGGGPLANAANKLKQYREIIDPLLDEPAGAKLRASASANGERLNIKVDVADVKGPPDNLRLCVAVVEDNVRYVGGNKLRFHHYVVRALPTGAEGVVLPANGQPYTASVDLKELRGKLSKYLDEYGVNRPFPNADRPMQFKNLRVIAFVQDDKSKEIVQATVVDFAGQSARR